MSKNKHIDLLLISVDSPVLLGIYEDKRLVRDFSSLRDSVSIANTTK